MGDREISPCSLQLKSRTICTERELFLGKMPKRTGRYSRIYLLDAHTVVRMGLAHLIRNDSNLKIVGNPAARRIA